jgi:short-subunit dehydrogenase
MFRILSNNVVKGNMQNMKDKVVIITGASSGIGLACACEFAFQGAKVVIAARNYDKLLLLEKQLILKGCYALAVKTDVSIEEDCKKLIETTVNAFGQIDVLVNNAGVSMRALFKDLNLDVIRRLMDVNFFGCVYCTKYALPYLLQTKGTVVGISSLAGFQGLPGRTGYSASKFALTGFLQTLRIENRKTGLHVLIVAPGFTSSNIRVSALVADGSPQGNSPRDENKMMTPEKVAKTMIKAILKRRNFFIFTLQGKLMFILRGIIPSIIERVSYMEMAEEPNSPFK